MDPNRIPVYIFFELFKNIIPTELSRIVHKYYYIVRICEKCSQVFDCKKGGIKKCPTCLRHYCRRCHYEFYRAFL